TIRATGNPRHGGEWIQFDISLDKTSLPATSRQQTYRLFCWRRARRCKQRLYESFILKLAALFAVQTGQR
ncbi:MAG: hypothetical protein ACXVJ0_16255, partial [Candidatus Angelobacter sp.]